MSKLLRSIFPFLLIISSSTLYAYAGHFDNSVYTSADNTIQAKIPPYNGAPYKITTLHHTLAPMNELYDATFNSYSPLHAATYILDWIDIKKTGCAHNPACIKELPTRLRGPMSMMIKPNQPSCHYAQLASHKAYQCSSNKYPITIASFSEQKKIYINIKGTSFFSNGYLVMAYVIYPDEVDAKSTLQDYTNFVNSIRVSS